MAQTTIKIRSNSRDAGPVWWQKFVEATVSSNYASDNLKLFRVLKNEFNLEVVQFNPKNPDSRAMCIKGDEKDITMFLLKWS